MYIVKTWGRGRRFYGLLNAWSWREYCWGNRGKYFFKNKSGELHTPIPDSFLDGITRREVIKIAEAKGIKVVQRKINPEEMKDFVGCFLTGTAAEVTPVSQISNYKFKVCNTITDLNDSYQNLVRKRSAA